MKADGTIYIDTEIDISGFQKGSQDLEAAAKRMATTVERIGKGLEESIGKNLAVSQDIGKASESQNFLEKMEDNAKNLTDQLDEAISKKQQLEQPSAPAETSIEIGGFQSGSKELESAARDMISIAEGLGKDIEISVQKRVNAFVKENQAISTQQQKVRDLQQQIAELSGKRIETDAFKAINANVEKLEKSLDSAIEKQIRFMETGGSQESRTFQTMEYDIQNITAQLEDAKRKKNELLASGGAYTQYDTSILEEMLSAETQRLSNMNNQLATSYADLQQRLNKYQDQLQETREQTEETASSTNNLGKSTSSFGKRLSRLISGALIFNVISSGLRSMTQYFGKALKSNTEFSAALAKLKAALLTAFQPIYEVIVPALTTLMRIMTAAITIIGQFFSAISGKSYAQMKDNAKALNDQTKAIKGVGGAAKDAGKQLMAFDELNVLSDQKAEGSGGGGVAAEEIAPDYSWTDELSDKIKKIAEDVLLVGVGFALWKISDSLPGKLGDILGKIGLIVIAIRFLKLSWDGFVDAWENGIDWSNLTQILIGVAGAALAIGFAFGTTAAAVVLLAGGIALVVVAIKEWIEKGELSNEMLVALEAGIMAVGGAIALMLGPSGWIALIVAAVAGAIVAIITRGQEIKNFIGKFFDWLKDIFSKDWTEIFGPILGTVLNNFFDHFSEIIDNLKNKLFGIIDFIQGVFTGNWEQAWDGIKNIVKNPINGIIGFINGMIGAITDGINFVINSVNRLGFTVPDWIPDIGGSKFGFNLTPITAYQIPMLAKGAVIPPRAPFTAILGDQSNGMNIEAPESLIRKIVREESGDFSRLEDLVSELIKVVQNIKVGDDVIGRAAKRYDRTTSIARGW